MFDGELPREAGMGSATRRVFLFGAVAAIVGAVAWRHEESQRAAVKAAPDNRPALVSIVEFSNAGAREVLTQVPRIVKTDEQWRAQLGRSVYEIARKGDTEFAFSGDRLQGCGCFDRHAAGVARNVRSRRRSRNGCV